MLEQIDKRGRTISENEREIKLAEFRKIQERIAKITKRDEQSQEEFNAYVDSLGPCEVCKYCTGVRNVVSLCTNPLFKCEYRSDDRYHIGENAGFECKREKIQKLRSLL